MPDEQPRKLSRRELLRSAGLAGAAALVPGSLGAAEPAASPPAGAGEPGEPHGGPGAASSPSKPRVYENLTAAEAETLEAIAARLIPNDEYGPGALEAGAVHYIDRALGGWLADSRPDYRTGLWAFDRYCRYSRGAPFVDLSERDQDSVLIDVQGGSATATGAGFTGSSAAFFNMIRSHVWQGTFGDPYYGGNADYVGWRLLRYPGIRTVVTDADQARLEAGQLPFSGRSAYDFDEFEKAQVRASPAGGTTHGD